MKYLIVLLAILAFLYGAKDIQWKQQETYTRLEPVAQKRIANEREQAFAHQRTNTIQKEAQRLGTNNVDTIGLVISIFGNDAHMALAIGMAEHGLACDTRVSPTNDYGPMQINIVHKWRFQGKSMFDCETNIKVAHDIFKEQGWRPWSSYTNGRYLSFL